jgi:CheY-like chemotaxis protein
MPTILVVDDDRETTDIFGRMLTLEGYDAQRAYSATEGLEKATTAPPDLLILDLRMPMMDGLEMLERIRAVDALRRVPAVIVTADYMIDEPTTDQLRALGAAVHFKPLWLEDLTAIVRRYIDPHRPAA